MVNPAMSFVGVLLAAPAGNVRSLPLTGARPSLQLPPTDQRLLTAPVHDLVAETTVNTTSLPVPPAYVICSEVVSTVNVAPSGKPANVPETGSTPSLAMITNDAPAAGDAAR